MLKTYLENIFLACVPIFTVTHIYDMSIHSLLAVVLMQEDSPPKYYIGSGMILVTTYSYFATHEHLKILFSIILAFSLLGCGFTNEMRKIESSYSADMTTCAVDTEEEEASPSVEEAPPPVEEVPPPVEELPPSVEEVPPPVEEAQPPVEDPPPAEEPPSPPSELRSTEKKRPRIVAKLATII